MRLVTIFSAIRLLQLKLFFVQLAWLKRLCATAGQSTMAAPRLLCMLGAGASAEVIEEYVSPASGAGSPHVTNAIAEIDLAEGASLKHG